MVHEENATKWYSASLSRAKTEPCGILPPVRLPPRPLFFLPGTPSPNDQAKRKHEASGSQRLRENGEVNKREGKKKSRGCLGARVTSSRRGEAKKPSKRRQRLIRPVRV